MKIAGMVVWVLTAGIGVYLLVAGIAAQRHATAGAGVGSRTAGPGAVVAGGAAGTEGSALLEFTHPMLALLGLTFWIFFVMTDGRLFAWIAFGVVVATVCAGLSWVIITRRAARLADGGHAFPAHLVMIHGLAAACTFALVVISAATATHG